MQQALKKPEQTPTHLTHHATYESKTNVLCFMQKDTHVLEEDTSYQTRPKIDAGDAFLLMGV